jgi:hypothetical protein
MLLNIFFGQDKHYHPQKYPLTRYVDKLNTNKLLIPSEKYYNFWKGFMFNVCNPTHNFLTQILNFFLNFLLKTHTTISCVQITPSHKCDKNQLCNNVKNTVKHTISIIISLLFSWNLTQKPSQKRCKNEKKFF